MNASSALRDIAESLVVGPGVAPGAALGVALFDGHRWRMEAAAAGYLDARKAEAVSTKTPFDLASVTKPVFALTLARLAATRRLGLEAALAAHLPEASGTPSAELSLELFLSHRAGLDAHRTLYRPLVAGNAFDRIDALREAALARRPEAKGAPPPEGFPPLYSDLGYLLLGAAVEASAGRALDTVIAEEVSEPLGLELGSARRLLGFRSRFFSEVAPTEIVDWRGGELRGVVHDENAWALGGHGACGHAGLFADVHAVLGFGARVLDVLAGRLRDFLEPERAELLVRPRPGGTLRAGFDGISPEGSAAGSQLGPRAFGHLGFTGTSLWCDPDAGWVTVLLTHRVHPSREHVEIRKARPKVQDALAAFARECA